MFARCNQMPPAIISPTTSSPMLHLKKYGECTLIDPRACIHHYECAADTACIMYAHISLRYFHYMVVAGYIHTIVGERERVVWVHQRQDTGGVALHQERHVHLCTGGERLFWNAGRLHLKQSMMMSYRPIPSF